MLLCPKNLSIKIDHQIQNRVRIQIFNQVAQGQARYQFYNPNSAQIQSQEVLLNPVFNQVWNQVKTQVRNSLGF